MGDGLQAEGSIAGLRKTPGCSASDVIDPSRCGRRSTPRVQRGRAQEDGMVVSRECTVNRRTWYHAEQQCSRAAEEPRVCSLLSLLPCVRHQLDLVHKMPC